MRTASQVLKIMQGWIGYNESNGKHKQIIDIYNNHKPLARGYKVKYTDQWCDTCISAAFIKAKATDLIGTECGVEQHVKIFKSKGIWEEDGRVTPKVGDIIVYNWDTKTQPNDGWSDHIGIIEKVANGMITAIEGNYNRAVARRTIKVGHGQIRGYARPKYAKETPKKSNSEIAKEVIAGKWGSGSARKSKLESAGYNYNTIQGIVNDMLKAPSTIDLTKVAQEVINGKWGNGVERKSKLEKAGYSYSKVQEKVNELLKGKTIKVGSKVKVIQGSKSYDGKNLASFIYNQSYDVIQIDGNRVVIGKGKSVTAAINKSDLILV